MSQKNLPDLAGFVHVVDDALRHGRQEPNRLQTCVQECRQFGVELLPLDINRSGRVCGEEDGRNIRIGLSLLAPEHDAFLDDLLSERAEKGAFQSFQDFCERIDRAKMPDDFLARAIQVGAFDALGPSRSRLFHGRQIVLQAIHKAAQERAAGQFDLFAALTPAVTKTAGLIALPPAQEWTEAEVIAQEKAAVGFSLLEVMAAADAANAADEVTEETQDAPEEKMASEPIAPPQPVAETAAPLTLTDESLAPEPVSAEERSPDISPDILSAEPERATEPAEAAGMRSEPEALLAPVDAEEPHDIAFILHLPADTPEAALRQLRDLLTQHPGPSPVILEFVDRYAQTLWVRTHAEYAVQMTPELIQAVEALIGAQTARQEAVRSGLLA